MSRRLRAGKRSGWRERSYPGPHAGETPALRFFLTLCDTACVWLRLCCAVFHARPV